MKFPTRQWLRIIEYREFFDFPRYFLASDGYGYWVLDGSFDDAKDEYSDDFFVRFVGTSEDEARELFVQQAIYPLLSSNDSMTIATKHVLFDITNRTACFVDLETID